MDIAGVNTSITQVLFIDQRKRSLRYFWLGTSVSLLPEVVSFERQGTLLLCSLDPS